MAALSYEARAELNVGMGFFLHVLMGGTYDTKRNPAAKIVAELAQSAGNPDADSFLKQAAVLHADVAAYVGRAPIETSRTAKGAGPRTEKLQIGGGTTTVHSDGPVPPLLTQNRLVLARDGQILGEAVASWNWPFGRSLLDLVGKDARALPQARKSRSAVDPFVSAWYHATTAYMFANGLYGDATPHLQHAADVLPDDAQILFDRGCYAELMGLPMHQLLLSEDAIGNRRADGGHRDGPPTWTPPRSAPPLRIPTADKANAEAERLYRRAVAVGPSLVEARVRLARLLHLRKRHEEAAAELKIALAGNPPPVVGFYARLFAGRVAQTMGEAAAVQHYRDALVLFPDAQSALLALSQLALLKSDVPATLAPVEHLGPRSVEVMADPWWQYHLCSGRDAEELLKALWSSVPGK